MWDFMTRVWEDVFSLVNAVFVFVSEMLLTVVTLVFAAIAMLCFAIGDVLKWVFRIPSKCQFGGR